MIPAPRISILEDSIEIRKLLENALLAEGFEVKAYGLAQQFESDIKAWSPDVCIVDLGLPDKDGLAILSHLANNFDTAIMVVSGRSTLSDKVAGLELGADDYVTKPFEVTELVARIRALIRRKTVTGDSRDNHIFQFSGWTADLSKFLLTSESGKEQRLSASEVALLEIFLRRANRLITRDQIREELGDRGDEFSFDRAIDVRVSRLRTKLKDSPKNSKIIQTIYGAGYILISDVS